MEARPGVGVAGGGGSPRTEVRAHGYLQPRQGLSAAAGAVLAGPPLCGIPALAFSPRPLCACDPTPRRSTAFVNV